MEQLFGTLSISNYPAKSGPNENDKSCKKQNTKNKKNVNKKRKAKQNETKGKQNSASGVRFE